MTYLYIVNVYDEGGPEHLTVLTDRTYLPRLLREYELKHINKRHFGGAALRWEQYADVTDEELVGMTLEKPIGLNIGWGGIQLTVRKLA